MTDFTAAMRGDPTGQRADPFRHNCDESDCPNFGKPTSKSSCRCHKTREEMMMERIGWLEAALSVLDGMLREHHQWHQEQTDINEHGFSLAEAYADSTLCDRTVSALWLAPSKDKGAGR